MMAGEYIISLYFAMTGWWALHLCAAISEGVSLLSKSVAESPTHPGLITETLACHTLCRTVKVTAKLYLHAKQKWGEHAWRMKAPCFHLWSRLVNTIEAMAFIQIKCCKKNNEVIQTVFSPSKLFRLVSGSCKGSDAFYAAYLPGLISASRCSRTGRKRSNTYRWNIPGKIRLNTVYLTGISQYT